MNRLDTFFSTDWTGYIKIALTLAALLLLTVLVAHYAAISKGEALTAAFKLEPKDAECKIVTEQGKRDFINAQRREIVAYANSHRETSIKFYGYFYSTYAVFSIFGLIAAISLAVITKLGIEKADNRVIAIFLVATGIVVLYQGFFGVFQQAGNIDSNAKLYVKYAQLVNQIDTYCTTGKLNVKDPALAFADSLPKSTPKPAVTNSTVTPANTTPANATPANATPKPVATATPPAGVTISPFYLALEPDEFINYIDWQIEHFKTIAIAIDATKIAAIDNTKFVLP